MKVSQFVFQKNYKIIMSPPLKTLKLPPLYYAFPLDNSFCYNFWVWSFLRWWSRKPRQNGNMPNSFYNKTPTYL